MAEAACSDHNVLFINYFTFKGKRHRVTLTSRSIAWEREGYSNSRTVIPLNEVIGVKPGDCHWNHGYRVTQNPQRCQSWDGQLTKATFTELAPLHFQSLQLYYAVRMGRYHWQLATAVFHPLEGALVREWISAVCNCLQGLRRPHKLLVFINPFGGKKKAPKIYDRKVSPLFQLAGIQAEVIVTQYANHAKDMLQETDLGGYDGIICVGGDGMFSELVNGILIHTQRQAGIDIDNIYSELSSPPLQLGVIPAGSTDAVAYGTTGINDPVSSTLLIIMGASVGVDVCGIHHEGKLLSFQTTFLAYGYFGDTLVDSEKHRWMGPTRYNWSGLKKFFKHQLYEGEIQLRISTTPQSTPLDHEQCTVGCAVCGKAQEKSNSPAKDITQQQLERERWLSVRDHFVAINVATMSCRCGLTPKGVSPSAHLGDGCTDVILISRCSRFNFFRFLFRMAFHNQNPFHLRFVQCYRVHEFRFVPYTNDDLTTPSPTCTGAQEMCHQLHSSVWNCDGEVISEPSIHVRTHCQLIKVFAYGIEERDPEPNCRHGLGFCNKK